MRITNQWIVNSFINQVNRNNTDLSEMQIKVSSGKKYIRASESPVDNALGMQNKVEINENTQFIRNIDNAKDWYNNTDGALTTLESAIQRVRELAVEVPTIRLCSRIAMRSPKKSMKCFCHRDIGNTQYREYIFAGHDVNNRPFSAVTGQTPGYNKGVVTYSLAENRGDVNKNSPLDIIFQVTASELPPNERWHRH